MTEGMAKWDMSIFHIKFIEKKDYVASWLSIKVFDDSKFLHQCCIGSNLR